MSSTTNVNPPATTTTAAPPPPPPPTTGAAATTLHHQQQPNSRKRPAPILTDDPDDQLLFATTTTTATTTTSDAEVAAIAALAAATQATTTTPSKKVMAITATAGGGRMLMEQHDRPMSRSPVTTPTTAGSAGSASATGTAATNKPYKGLRHFSMMVCKKVEEKGTTTYNEVADELVQHVISERHKEQQQQQMQQQDASTAGTHFSSMGMSGSGSGSGGAGGGTASKQQESSKFDEKNIRRRVYDALNVLMAMDIIQKDKKTISWKGLPTSAHQDLDMLQRERDYRLTEVQRKREALRELLVQQVCFRNLVAYNQRRAPSEKSGVAAMETTTTSQDAATTPSATTGANAADHKIPLPFIIVNTHSTAVIQCNMSVRLLLCHASTGPSFTLSLSLPSSFFLISYLCSPLSLISLVAALQQQRDLTDVMFDFSQPFEINDDNTILKRLGMDKISRPALVEMLPDELLNYAESHHLLSSILVDDDTATSTPMTTAPITAAAAAAVTVGGTPASSSADYHPPTFM
jgi:E2F/DP family winged-helix DNA-binding domain/Transcription factor DP